MGYRDGMGLAFCLGNRHDRMNGMECNGSRISWVSVMMMLAILGYHI